MTTPCVFCGDRDGCCPCQERQECCGEILARCVCVLPCQLCGLLMVPMVDELPCHGRMCTDRKDKRAKLDVELKAIEAEMRALAGKR